MSGRRAKQLRRQKWGEARSFLRAFMEEIRGLFRRLARDHYRRFPGARRPCETCAFRAWTDTDPLWRTGRDHTAWHLLEALWHDDAFYCHEGMTVGAAGEFSPPADRSQLRLCGGWGVVCADPEAKVAMLRAARRAM